MLIFFSLDKVKLLLHPPCVHKLSDTPRFSFKFRFRLADGCEPVSRSLEVLGHDAAVSVTELLILNSISLVAGIEVITDFPRQPLLLLDHPGVTHRFVPAR